MGALTMNGLTGRYVVIPVNENKCRGVFTTPSNS